MTCLMTHSISDPSTAPFLADRPSLPQVAILAIMNSFRGDALLTPTKAAASMSLRGIPATEPMLDFHDSHVSKAAVVSSGYIKNNALCQWHQSCFLSLSMKLRKRKANVVWIYVRIDFVILTCSRQRAFFSKIMDPCDRTGHRFPYTVRPLAISDVHVWYMAKTHLLL